MRSFARAMISNVDAGSAASATELQRRMSDTAGRYLDRLSLERSGDEGLQLEIAEAYMELGIAQGAFMNANQADPAGALANFRQARDIARAQWKARHDRSAAEDLVACVAIIGVLPDPAATVSFLREEASLASEVTSAFPNDSSLLRRSAGLYGTGGQRLRSTGDLNGALAMFRRAVDLSNGALQVLPDDPGALHTLETYMCESGTTLRMKGDYTSALKNQQEAHRIALRVLQLKR